MKHMRETSGCWQWFPHPDVDGNREARLTAPSMGLNNMGVFDVRGKNGLSVPKSYP